LAPPLLAALVDSAPAFVVPFSFVVVPFVVVPFVVITVAVFVSVRLARIAVAHAARSVLAIFARATDRTATRRALVASVRAIVANARHSTAAAVRPRRNLSIRARS